MPLNRFLNLPHEDKERVLQIAKKQFSHHGYDAMSLNLLLKELDISEGQFYYWFEDKADLFFTVLKQGIDALQQRLNDHGMPKSKSKYWEHMRNSRLISEMLWKEKDFVEIGQIIYRQIPQNHPLYERLQECGAPLRVHFCDGIQLGQTWGFVRTDLSASALYDLTDGLSDVFYSKILNTYDKDSAPFAQAVTLHELLGKTLRFVLTSEGHNDS
ncbi:MAG: TetR/AcrR family transcriptional regulator [Euryarchaeota archaeon]|nr:TetR/AcrR family transcriptional regulator [Euryarchaeota archaeon]